MKAYQVLNEDGYPASNEFNSLAIFAEKEEAERYEDYLAHEVGLNVDSYKIVQIRIDFAVNGEGNHE